jgi:uncharacterized membrane protein YphA (DoxX/SURF4 family)
MPISYDIAKDISIIVYFMAVYILLSGILITIGKYVKPIALILAIFLFACLLLGHIPARLLHYSVVVNNWMDAIKILALSGGALITALAYPEGSTTGIFNKLNKIAPAGIWFFAIMLCLFGFGHLRNAQNVSKLVPKYIPWAIFWTYVSGIALLGSGISFLIGFQVKRIAFLLGVALFLWLIMLHLYYAIRFPQFQDGENIIGSFECLAFCGIALLISIIYPRQRQKI